MDTNKIKISSRESVNRVCFDLRAEFLGQHIVLESFLYSQRGQVDPAVRAFQAAAEGVFVVLNENGLAQVIVENEDSESQPLLQGYDLEQKVEDTLKRRANVPA